VTLRNERRDIVVTAQAKLATSCLIQ